MLNVTLKSDCKHIVIIGNGGAGSQTTALLSKMAKKSRLNCHLTVLSPLEYTEVSVSMTTNLVVRGAHGKSLFPPVCEPGVDYLVDGCKELKPNSIITSTGKEVQFDVCVVATGQNIPVFMPSSTQKTRVDRERYIADFVEKVHAAKNIVISGGNNTVCGGC